MKLKEQEIPSLIRSGKDDQVVPWLYKTIFPSVRNYIVSHGGIKDDAYDAFQDALLYFYNLIISKRFDEEKYAVGGFLYRLSINRWLNKLKKNKPLLFQDELEDNDLQSSYQINFHSIDLVQNDENLLRKLFSGIGEKCIEVLNLSIYSDMLMEDIAERLDFASVGAVKMQLKRCKEKLAKELDQNPALLKHLTHE